MHNTHLALFAFSQKKKHRRCEQLENIYILITDTIILVDGYKFTDKDGLDFTFIWVHDRGDRRGVISRRVREKLELRIQNGGLTTQHDTEKRRESFLFGPFLTGILTFKWVKVSISFNFTGFFFHDPSRSELIRPGLAVRVNPVRLLYLPHCKQMLFSLKTNVVRAMKISSWNCTCNKQKSTSSSGPVKVNLERLNNFYGIYRNLRSGVLLIFFFCFFFFGGGGGGGAQKCGSARVGGRGNLVGG